MHAGSWAAGRGVTSIQRVSRVPTETIPLEDGRGLLYPSGHFRGQDGPGAWSGALPLLWMTATAVSGERVLCCAVLGGLLWGGRFGLWFEVP